MAGVRKGTKKSAEDIRKLKEQYLIVFARVPHQSLAANMIGREGKTVGVWKQKDAKFREKVKEVESMKVKGWIDSANPEFLLERTYPAHYGKNRDEAEQATNINVFIDRDKKEFGL